MFTGGNWELLLVFNLEGEIWRIETIFRKSRE